MKYFTVPEVRTAALSNRDFALNIILGLVFPEAENRYAPLTQILCARGHANNNDPRLWAAISTLEGFVVNKGKIV